MWTLLLIGIVTIVVLLYKEKQHSKYNNYTELTNNDTPARSDDCEIETGSSVKAPNSYIVFDLETTGLNKHKDQILEIGAIKYHNFIEIGRFHSYAKPTIPISPSASSVNGIYYKDVCNSPSISKVLGKFKVFIEGYPLLAHNANFDSGFILNQSSANNINLNNIKYYDTLRMARGAIPQLPNHKLETIKQFLNVNVGSHNAIDDCQVTNELYKYCIKIAREDNQRLISESKKQQESLDISNWCSIKNKDTKVLSETMQDYFDEFCKILTRNNINLAPFDRFEGVNCLTIRYELIHPDASLCFGEPILFIYLGARLQYCLIDIPIDKFEDCELSLSNASKNEGTNKTRVFLTNATDLQLIEKQILEICYACIKRHNQYIELRKSYYQHFM